MDAAELAQAHWNETPLSLSEQERYRIYPWLYEAAGFRRHEGQRVLEIGCGTGCDLLQFAKNGAIATGIDITAEHIRLAKERVHGMAEVIHGDGRAIPFPDCSFDYVYSHGVLHHSDEPEKIVAEIMRVLRPGGRFNIHVYGLFSWFALKGILSHQWRFKRHIENSTAPVHIELYTSNRLRALFPVFILISRYEHGWFLVADGAKPY